MVAAFRSIASVTYASRTNTTVTPPSGIVNGDILIAVIFCGAAGSVPAVTLPSGFTIISTPTVVADTGSFTGRLTLAWKRAASESGNYVFTHAACSTQAYVAAYSGAIASGSPIDVSSSNSSGNAPTIGGVGQTTTALSVTPTPADDLLLYIAHDWNGTGTLTPPTGMTERFDSLVYTADQALSSSSATGDRIQTNGNGASGEPWAAWLVALKAATGGGSTTNQTINITSSATVAAVRQARKITSRAATIVVAAKRGIAAKRSITNTVSVVAKRALTTKLSITSALSVTKANQARKAFNMSATATVAAVASRAFLLVANIASTIAVSASRAVSTSNSVLSTLSIARTKRVNKFLGITVSLSVVRAKAINKINTILSAISVSASGIVDIISNVYPVNVAIGLVVSIGSKRDIAIHNLIVASVTVAGTKLISKLLQLVGTTNFVAIHNYVAPAVHYAITLSIQLGSTVSSGKSVTKIMLITVSSMVGVFSTIKRIVFSWTKRLFVAPAESRTLILQAETRSFTTVVDNRTLVVEADTRSLNAEGK